MTSVELDHHATYASELELERDLPAVPRATPRGRHRGPVGARGVGRAKRAQGDHLRAWRRRLAASTRDRACRRRHALRAVQRRSTGAERLLPVPGEHNVLNALAALAAAEAVGCPPERAAAALGSFRPAARRFEPVGEAGGKPGGALVFDDYAHHPTEVEATLRAARALEPKRLIAAFQPHLYSRTLHLHREFGRALALADVVVVLDVYAAREEPAGELEGVTGKLVADAAADRAGGRAGLVAARDRGGARDARPPPRAGRRCW